MAGGGNDTIYAHSGLPTTSTIATTGQDLIVGGSGTDKIYGWDSSYQIGTNKTGDLIIAGTTNLSTAALQSVLSEWSSVGWFSTTTPYATRIAYISGNSGTGGAQRQQLPDTRYDGFRHCRGGPGFRHGQHDRRLVPGHEFRRASQRRSERGHADLIRRRFPSSLHLRTVDRFSGHSTVPGPATASTNPHTKAGFLKTDNWCSTAAGWELVVKATSPDNTASFLGRSVAAYSHEP